MKSNVVMKSEDRTLFGSIVRQETKTGMLSVSDLGDIAAKRNAEKGYSIKHIPELIQRRENVERIYFILKEQGFINVDPSTFIEMVGSNGITRTLKAAGAWKTTGARHTKSTWANPYIWMLIALEVSPEIYGKAIAWLTDKLIINRIEAGNFYKEMTSALRKLGEKIDYSAVARAINYIVFNRHELAIRNTATQHQLKEIEDIEKKVAFVINLGFVTNFDALMKMLRAMYAEKYGQPKNIE